MKVDVLLFGGAAAAVGTDRARVDVPASSTCAAVLEKLGESEPRLRAFVGAGRLAVNHAFVGPERVIREGDEVALIALVSGG